MLKDHELKDKFLSFLIEKDAKSRCSPESMSALFKISKERSKRLLEEIHQDGYCTKDRGYGSHEFECAKNVDTAPFLKSGGYAKLAHKEYWEKFPAKKWFIYDPLKYIIGIVIGAILTMSTEQLWSPLLKSEDNKGKRQDSISTVGKDTIPALEKDTSK